MHPRSFLAALGLIVASAGAAAAGGFDVKTPDVTKGETEISASTALLSGYPVNADLLKFGSELSIGRGLTDWWRIGAKAIVDRPVGGDLSLITAGIEAQVLLRKREPNGLGLAWYMSAERRIADDAANSLTFGPLLQIGSDTTTLTFNPLFVRSFGSKASPGTDFAYAWQVKHEVRDGFGVGIEGYGLVPNIGDAPGSAFQEHRVGPVLYFERSLARGTVQKLDLKGAGGAGGDGVTPKLSVEAGLLFGLTEATQDRVLKLKGGITF